MNKYARTLLSAISTKRSPKSICSCLPGGEATAVSWAPHILEKPLHLGFFTLSKPHVRGYLGWKIASTVVMSVPLARKSEAAPRGPQRDPRNAKAATRPQLQIPLHLGAH